MLLHLAIALLATFLLVQGGHSFLLIDEHVLCGVAGLYIVVIWIVQLLVFRRFRNSKRPLRWLGTILVSIPLGILRRF